MFEGFERETGKKPLAAWPEFEDWCEAQRKRALAIVRGIMANHLMNPDNG
jgi:hypothetical protein